MSENKHRGHESLYMKVAFKIFRCSTLRENGVKNPSDITVGLAGKLRLRAAPWRFPRPYHKGSRGFRIKVPAQEDTHTIQYIIRYLHNTVSGTQYWAIIGSHIILRLLKSIAQSTSVNDY